MSGLAAPTEAVDPSSARPTPTDEELVAIMAAVEVAWPRPVIAAPSEAQPSTWRFSGRWWSKPISSRRRRS